MELSPADLMHFLEVLQMLAGPLLVLILSAYGLIRKGEIDLIKTLAAAEDVLDVVKHVMEHDGAKLEDALEKGVDAVEELRKKRLSSKLRAKAKARIRARLGKEE